MEYFKISFNARIRRLLKEGFSALQDEYLITFQDKKKTHLFEKGDNISITIENANDMGEEIVSKGYSIIYCILKNYVSNGFQFVDVNNQSKGFFWNYRGLISEKSLEKNEYWDRDTLLKITILKV